MRLSKELSLETTNLSKRKESPIDPDEVYQLYFKKGLTMVQVGQRLGYESASPIRRIFRERGWTPRRINPIVRSREDLDEEEVRRLYFDLGLSLLDVAKEMHTSTRHLRRLFRERGWKAHYNPLMRDSKTVDSDGFEPHHVRITDPQVLAKEVYRLYFDEGLSQSHVGDRLGYSVSVIRRIFRENGWTVRISIGAGTRRRYFKTDEERRLAKHETTLRSRHRIIELRETIFGTKCRICGEERKLAIHRKDGTEHDEHSLWRVTYLSTVDPNEWAALCIPCHRGAHWMLDTHGVQFDELERLGKSVKTSKSDTLVVLSLPSSTMPSSTKYEEIKPHLVEDVEGLRRALFGENCYLCNAHYEETTLVIHRKDGKSHSKKLIEYERYFRVLNPEEWVSLCKKCHRFVHWAMDKVGLDWQNLI